MSISAELLVKTGRFLDAELSFAELADWVQDREDYWVTLSSDAVARALADTIMLTAYEIGEGARNEEEARQLVAGATLESAPNP